MWSSERSVNELKVDGDGRPFNRVMRQQLTDDIKVRYKRLRAVRDIRRFCNLTVRLWMCFELQEVV